MKLIPDPLKPYADLIRIGLVLLLVALLIGIGWYAGASKWERKYDAEAEGHKATKVEHARVLSDLAAHSRAVADKAKAAAIQVKREREAANRKYEDATREADRREAALRADLRRGAVRLQDRWTCDTPRPAAGGAAAYAGQAAAEGRYDSAARIVAAADADAAVIDWLWESWQADRRAVTAAGCAVEALP